jgi:hypothetical protein
VANGLVDSAAMVFPPGLHQEISTRREFSGREKKILGGVVLALAIFAVAIIVAVTGPSQTSARGCVDVSIVGATGNALIHQCGADARTLCRDAGKSGGYTGETGRQIRAACRKDGFAVGPISN